MIVPPVMLQMRVSVSAEDVCIISKCGLAGHGTHLHCHANMGVVQEDVSLAPGGEPGGGVGAGGAQGADGLPQGHHPVDEGGQQAGLALPCHQDLVQRLSTQHIPLHSGPTPSGCGVRLGGRGWWGLGRGYLWGQGGPVTARSASAHSKSPCIQLPHLHDAGCGWGGEGGGVWGGGVCGVRGGQLTGGAPQHTACPPAFRSHWGRAGAGVVRWCGCWVKGREERAKRYITFRVKRHESGRRRGVAGAQGRAVRLLEEAGVGKAWRWGSSRWGVQATGCPRWGQHKGPVRKGNGSIDKHEQANMWQGKTAAEVIKAVSL